MKKRVHIYYSGMVQGVGFRFTAEEMANTLGLTGWAKNLPDGKVEVLCEGEKADLVSFIDKMKSGSMRDYIRSADVEWGESRNEFENFTVLF
ncbi:MAG: acylphosphatase [Candidatus Omnitrophica bacterium]|nr:acylphosphatase [Candidatus Omnitrophota bacterium]